MSIEIRKVDDFYCVYGVWDGVNCAFVDPQFLNISEEDIKKYVKNKPFPKDSKYSLEDCINDLSGSEACYVIPCESLQTAEYIAEMISKMI